MPGQPGGLLELELLMVFLMKPKLHSNTSLRAATCNQSATHTRSSSVTIIRHFRGKAEQLEAFTPACAIDDFAGSGLPEKNFPATADNSPAQQQAPAGASGKSAAYQRVAGGRRARPQRALPGSAQRRLRHRRISLPSIGGRARPAE